MPHRRYHGKTGIVGGVRGDSYEVRVSLGGKVKTLYVRPEHLRPTPEVWERVVKETTELVNSVKTKITEVRGLVAKALSG